jgi:hypothetical protein
VRRGARDRLGNVIEPSHQARAIYDVFLRRLVEHALKRTLLCEEMVELCTRAHRLPSSAMALATAILAPESSMGARSTCTKTFHRSSRRHTLTA